MKKLALVLLIAAMALPLLGCDPTVHGGGQVTLLGGNMDVQVDEGWQNVELQPGTATFAISAMCNDHKDAVMSNIEWNDLANDFRFHARLRWTTVGALTDGAYATCEELAAATDPNMPLLDGSMAMGYVNEQGQEIGDVMVLIVQPGQTIPAPINGDPCDGSTLVYVTGSGSELPHYTAYGCLARGSIVFP